MRIIAKFYFLTFTIFFSLTLSANIKSDDFYNDAIRLIKSDMTPFIKSLSRDIYVYHWAPLKKMKIKPTARNYVLKYKKAHKHLKKRMNMFKKHYKTREWAVGNGLYAATNPATSAWYGGERWVPWGMIEILVPTGTRFLDLRLAYDKILLKERTFQFLNETCGLDQFETGHFTVDGHKYIGVHKMSLTSKKVCRKVLLESVRQLNIGFFAYLWVGNENYKDICDRTDGPFDHKGSSLLLINIDISKKSYNFFSEGLDGIHKNKNAFYKYKELHDKMLMAKPHLGERDHAVWPYFDQFPKTKGLNSLLQKTTFTCMKKYKEDQIRR